MDKKYLDKAALKELIRRIMTGIDPICHQDQETIEAILPSFHAYVDEVVKGETRILLNPQAAGQPFRDMMIQYDQNRHCAHETAIINVRVLNRLADMYDLPPVYTGSSEERHQVAAFCLELDTWLFENRRMKLS